LQEKIVMDALTPAERRFLDRVAKITLTPWSGKLVAVDKAGKTMRLSKATFQRLQDGGFVIRTESTLTTNVYGPQPPVVAAAPVGEV
jgi:hypothetical protein